MIRTVSKFRKMMPENYSSRRLFDEYGISDGYDSDGFKAYKNRHIIKQTKLIPLADAPRLIKRSKVSNHGIYVIFKRIRSNPRSIGERVYVGKSVNLASRIGQHRWCLTHLKANISDYKVKVYYFPAGTDLKAREREYRRIFPGKFSHQIDTADYFL